MRQILVDYARRAMAAKRSGGHPVSLDPDSIGDPGRPEELLALDPARTAGRAPRSNRRAPFLRWPVGGGDLGCPRDIAADGEAGLAQGSRISLPDHPGRWGPARGVVTPAPRILRSNSWNPIGRLT
jgi:hypothetical protein